jgi:putative transposase
MVAAVRRGQPLRAVARAFGVGVATVAQWVERAEGQRLDRVEWCDRSHAPHKPRRTATAVEDLVLTTRGELAHGDLGAIGAEAIRNALLQRGIAEPPALRTINRILARRGALDGRKRTRRPPPPKGWYLPEVAKATTELGSFDIVEGLVIKGGPQVEALNGCSLHGGLVASWPVESPVTAEMTVQSLVEHWRKVGLPGYAQFDNDMTFHGTHRYPDALGRIIRLCLSLGVVPVFVPPRETGFQAMIEGYNGWWQSKVWSRFQHANLADLQGHSHKYVAAVLEQRAARIEAAPDRRPFPASWKLDLKKRPSGRVVYLRRSNADSAVILLGQTWALGQVWPNRLVRCVVDLDKDKIRFFTLRRKEPSCQPQILEVVYRLPNRGFQD